MIDDMDMGDVLECWEQEVILKTITRPSSDFDINDIDFDETEGVTPTIILSVVQPADKDKLNPANIDWSLDYQWLHTKAVVAEGDFIEYQGRDYKIISRKPYGDYGYYELVGEETKRTLKA